MGCGSASKLERSRSRSVVRRRASLSPEGSTKGAPQRAANALTSGEGEKRPCIGPHRNRSLET
jgi:hypothetical protein